MARQKVTIVGAGATGGMIAQLLAMRGIADTVLYDVRGNFARGRALDIRQSGALLGFDVSVRGTDEIADTADSDILINTAGAPRKPGQTREELAAFTARILKELVPPLAKASPQAIYIGFTNPMDAATQLAMELGKFSVERVVGQGGLLDSARFRTNIADCAHCPVCDVQAYVLGGHTEATMVPVVSTATVASVPLRKLYNQPTIAKIVAATKYGGAKIVELMETGSAFSAPAAATVAMIEAILLDQHRVMPCSVYAEGDYSIEGAFIGLMTKLGRQGVETVVEVPLDSNELEDLRRAAEATKALVATMRDAIK